MEKKPGRRLAAGLLEKLRDGGEKRRGGFDVRDVAAGGQSDEAGADEHRAVLGQAGHDRGAHEDDHADLSYADLVEIGIHYDTLSTAFEET